MAQVSKSDREYMIGWLESKIQAKINAALSEHRDEVESFRAEVTATVDATEVGIDFRRLKEIEAQISKLREESREIENKYYRVGRRNGIHSERDNNIEHAVKAWTDAQDWGVGHLREQFEKVHVSLLFATTEASLQRAVTKLLQAIGIEGELE